MRTLSKGRRALLQVSGALAARDPSLLRASLEGAARSAAFGEVEEALLQSYLFLGFPAALNAFALWRELTGAPPLPPIRESRAEWPSRGEEVCRRVYGGQYERLRENIRALHPEMEEWMVVEGYGKVLGRPGLELSVRELCIVTLLAVLGAPRQLRSHLRGALNAGATAGEVEEALEVAREILGGKGEPPPREVWEEVLRRSPQTPPLGG